MVSVVVLLSHGRVAHMILLVRIYIFRNVGESWSADSASAGGSAQLGHLTCQVPKAALCFY